MPVTKSGRRPRQRWSREEKSAHLAAQRTSGLSVRKYSESHGVPLSTLQLWRKQQKPKRVPSFARVELAPITGPAITVTLRRRDGVVVEVTGLDQPGLIAALRSVLS